MPAYSRIMVILTHNDDDCVPALYEAINVIKSLYCSYSHTHTHLFKIYKHIQANMF